MNCKQRQKQDTKFYSTAFNCRSVPKKENTGLDTEHYQLKFAHEASGHPHQWVVQDFSLYFRFKF